MNIGIFDSGLGGLMIAKSLMASLPEYNYVYLGDTKRVPYGNRSLDTVYEFTVEAVRYLFEREECSLIIIACNTASAEAVHRVQQEYVPVHFSDRKVLGMIIPTAEAVARKDLNKVGVLATSGTVKSGAYTRELTKLIPEIITIQQEAPLLVPLIEHDAKAEFIRPILQEYVDSLLKEGVQGIVLGCTHCAALKQLVREMVGKTIEVYSQDELLPDSLRRYLAAHPQLSQSLKQEAKRRYLVTDEIFNQGFKRLLTPEEHASVEIISL